jgi:hypothetical protein
MIETRQLRSLAAVGFFLALFIGDRRDATWSKLDNRAATQLLLNSWARDS